MIATSQVISLGTGFSTLAFLGARQLLETSMEIFDLPPIVIG
ncbi:hypothetical protein ACFS25_13125 [Spirosoma flavum]|uniref:Uncharacterized protein n=1 Tax=Spirosoma flavum TaxID=2048557 RepID=A0ABW6AH02_9BACT